MTNCPKYQFLGILIHANVSLKDGNSFLLCVPRYTYIIYRIPYFCPLDVVYELRKLHVLVWQFFPIRQTDTKSSLGVCSLQLFCHLHLYFLCNEQKVLTRDIQREGFNRFFRRVSLICP